MIAEIREGQLREHNMLLEALSLVDITGSEPRIAAVGAGGKTTVLKRLAEEYLALGRQSVIITTTHMKKENTEKFLVDPSEEEILRVQRREGYVIAGAEAETAPAPDLETGENVHNRGARSEKIRALLPDILEKVLDFGCPVLIEADGARMLPVKIPAEHEPVFAGCETCVLAVYGLDALGQKIRDAGFRAERMAEFLHKDVKDRLEARDIAALALSCQGGRKGVAEDIQYRVVLNKADTEERRGMALEVWKEMERIRGCCGMREVRTVVVGMSREMKSKNQ